MVCAYIIKYTQLHHRPVSNSFFPVIFNCWVYIHVICDRRIHDWVPVLTRSAPTRGDCLFTSRSKTPQKKAGKQLRDGKSVLQRLRNNVILVASFHQHRRLWAAHYLTKGTSGNTGGSELLIISPREHTPTQAALNGSLSHQGNTRQHRRLWTVHYLN